MCIFCSQAFGGESGAIDTKKYKYTIDDFGLLSVKPLHLDSIYDFGPKAFTNTTVGTYVYNECLDKDVKQTNNLTQIELDQNQLEVHSVEIIVNNDDNTLFKPADLDLFKNDWVKHREQFEGIPTTEDEEKTWSNDGKLKFTPITNFTVDQSNQKLIIPLPDGMVIKPGQQFILRTKTTSVPNDYDLEGMYYDSTPTGCPQTLISQNQQYGFRKMTPTIDQMPSKCAYTTTIIADGRYTNVLCNGDFAPGFYQTNSITGLVEPFYHNPSSYFPRNGGDDKTGVYESRKVLKYYNFQLMATYLFFLGLGTYITYSRDVEYPLHKDDPYNLERIAKGEKPVLSRDFRIDLITAPNLFKHHFCVEKLKIIHDSITWVYISGPSRGTCDYKPLREEIYKLIKRREEIKDLLGLGQYGVYAQIDTISSEDANTNPVIAKYTNDLKENEANEDAQHMKGPVSKYDKVAFPLDIKPNDTTLLQELESIRQQLSDKISSVDFSVWGHQYTQQQYREIGMSASNYGGMENVGNTTILSSRLVPNPLLSDNAYLYLVGVTIHEFYHDINGSLVTGQSPFTIWLNEAMTVHVQRLYENEQFTYDTMRSQQVSYAKMPSSGPLAVDSAPNAMAVIPPGFNETQELISAMTYSKAPEITKTFERLLGTSTFYKGLRLYYDRFARGNAKTEDWVQAMVDVSGDQSLFQMADKWLKVSGHPTLEYNGTYNAETKQYTLHLKQTGWEHHTLVEGPWRFAVEIELFNAKGDKLIPQDAKKGCSGHVINSTEGEAFVYDMNVAETDVVFDNIEQEPAFASVARGWSFFGQCKNVSSTKDKELLLQVKYDDDCVNKMVAWSTYKEAEVVRLTKAMTEIITNKTSTKVEPNQEWVDMHASTLFDKDISPSARASILDESSAVCSDPTVAHEYFATSNAITALFQGLWAKYSKELVTLYHELNKPEYRKWPLSNGFNERPLKRHLLWIFYRAGFYESIINTEYPTLSSCGIDLFQLCQELVFDSEIMSDKLMGLACGMNIIANYYQVDSTNTTEFILSEGDIISDAESIPSAVKTVANNNFITKDIATKFLIDTEKFFTAHPTSLEMYIGIIGGTSSAFGESFIRQLIDKSYFQLSSPLHARTLARSWSSIRPRALLTTKGLDLTKFLMFKIGKVNAMSAFGFLQLFGDINKFDDVRKATLTQCLEDMLSKFDPEKDRTLCSNIRTILNKQ